MNTSPINNNITEDEEQPAQQAEQQPPATKRYMVLPYVSHKIEAFTKRLKAHVKKFFPQVDFNVAYRTPNEIDKFFPFKDRVKQITKRSLVVYRLKCQHEGCGATYIGKTARILGYRMKEHQTSSSSACKQHEDKNPGHLIEYEKIEILDTAETNFKLEIKELLQIIKHKPSLNRQLNLQSKYNIRTLIIAAYPHTVEGDATN